MVGSMMTTTFTFCGGFLLFWKICSIRYMRKNPGGERARPCRGALSLVAACRSLLSVVRSASERAAAMRLIASAVYVCTSTAQRYAFDARADAWMVYE